MAEYIEKTRLLERLTDYYNCAAMDYTIKLSVCTAADCLSIVKKAPVADVVEVKHGEWTKDDSDGCFCSFCGWYTDYDYDYVTNNGLGNDDFIYCSHCGAKMDGGANDEM